MRIILAEPRGYCAGVVRAVEIVEEALRRYGPPVYVRHQIVHNQRVLADLRARGVVFVDELDEVPDGAITVLSAHGVARRVHREAATRELPVIDATCPLVSRVHHAARRHSERGRLVIVIGHAGHPEVIGTLGQIPGPARRISTVAEVAELEVDDPDQLAYVTQTTLSVDDTRQVVDALQRRFPAIIGPELRDICYASQNRQHAVRQLAGMVDRILVIGSANSSNSNRLRDLGAALGVPSELVENADSLDLERLRGVATLGITAGASAPEVLVREVVDRLRTACGARVESHSFGRESVTFRLPRNLPAPDRRPPAASVQPEH